MVTRDRMGMIRRIATAFLAATVLAGCSHTDNGQKLLVIYSPNGEPLTGGPLGHPECAMVIGRWLDRVDLNHDGVIELGEYLADARRQFRVMDLDGTGTLTPSELAQYRAPYNLDVKPQSGRDDASTETDDRPDPVMAADSKMRFEVTIDEFLIYQQQYFAALDGGNTGRVARAVFLRVCGKS